MLPFVGRCYIAGVDRESTTCLTLLFGTQNWDLTCVCGKHLGLSITYTQSKASPNYSGIMSLSLSSPSPQDLGVTAGEKKQEWVMAYEQNTWHPGYDCYGCGYDQHLGQVARGVSEASNSNRHLQMD